MTTICISNEKGGVAKTTTAVNLAHGLALAGDSVLLIDFDSQGSAALSLGIEPSAATYDLLIEGEPLTKLVAPARDNLDILTSNYLLAEARDILAARYNSADVDRRKRATKILDKAIRGKGSYDFVIIDCAPSLDILGLNALMASDQLLVPTSADYLSAAGTASHLQTLELIDQLGGDIELKYIVPTRYDGRTRRGRRILEILNETYEGLVTLPIRSNTHIAEAAHYGQTIFEHAPTSHGAEDYTQLAESIINGKE